MLLDEKGVIREKLFYAGYKTRHGADEILAAAATLDEEADPRPGSAAAAGESRSTAD